MNTAATITVIEYDRMIAQGAFDGPYAKRLELIRGELREMSPSGIDHEDIVDWLTEWSYVTVDRKAVKVRVQESVGIPELETIPQPDVAWVQRHTVRRRPRPTDLLLLIEVADSSLGYDTGEKAQLYAEAGVEDYWVVDVQRRLLHVFRDPTAEGYQTHRTLQAGDQITPLGVPQASLDVGALFSILDIEVDLDES
jgi:Uma2 family endonuclease